jgi:hypothetical protein
VLRVVADWAGLNGVSVERSRDSTEMGRDDAKIVAHRGGTKTASTVMPVPLAKAALMRLTALIRMMIA